MLHDCVLFPSINLENLCRRRKVRISESDPARAANDEGGLIDNFSLRYAESCYEALFAEDHAGPTCVWVSSDTTAADMEYTILLIYTASEEYPFQLTGTGDSAYCLSPD